MTLSCARSLSATAFSVTERININKYLGHKMNQEVTFDHHLYQSAFSVSLSTANMAALALESVAKLSSGK